MGKRFCYVIQQQGDEQFIGSGQGKGYTGHLVLSTKMMMLSRCLCSEAIRKKIVFKKTTTKKQPEQWLELLVRRIDMTPDILLFAQPVKNIQSFHMQTMW